MENLDFSLSPELIEGLRAFPFDPSNYAFFVAVASAVLIPALFSKRQTRAPNDFMVLFATVLFIATPFLVKHTPVLKFNTKDLTVMPTVVARKQTIKTETPLLHERVTWNTKFGYKDFYEKIYTKAHEEITDIDAHVLLLISVAFFMCSDTRYMVPWMLSLAFGALATRPLMLLSVQFGWLEPLVIFAIGAFFARRYGVLMSWTNVFLLWVSLDAASHHVFGHNLDYALWTGKYALSWGMYGQTHLTLSTLNTMTSNIYEQFA